MKIETVIDLYRSVYYLKDEDTDMIPLLLAVTAQSRVEGKCIGVWLVGGSSAGKTALLDALGDISFVKEVSIMTDNTLLSGAIVKGQETSLLTQIGKGGGVITFKDFTTMLSMNDEKQRSIMAQFRQVFDGHLTKQTGTGKFLEWKGKVNIIAGVTEEIHVQRAKFDAMGSRNVFYTFPDLTNEEREATTWRAINNMDNPSKLRKSEMAIKAGFAQYVDWLIAKIIKDPAPVVPMEMKDNIVKLSNFVSRAVTAVARNYRKEMELMLSTTLPMRFAQQSISLASTFMSMNDNVLPNWGERLVYKTLIDSISKQRLMCLRMLAKYRESTTKGVSIALGYEVDLVGEWLADLDALRMAKRIISSDGSKTRWILNEEYRQIMVKYDGVEYIDMPYLGTEADRNIMGMIDDGTLDPSEMGDNKAEVQALWNGM